MGCTWDDDRHVLSIVATSDEDYPLELEVEHPRSCKVYVGCVSTSKLECYGHEGWHVHSYHDCPVGYSIEAIGADEALFGLSMTGPKGYNLIEEPPENIGPVWEEVRRRFMAGEEDFRIPLKLHWSGGYDYWGEWDDYLEVEINGVH